MRPAMSVTTDKLFFRARTRLDYQEGKDENVLPEQRYTLYHQIHNRLPPCSLCQAYA